MNNVIINRGQGGLGRQPLGQDYISGLIFYNATLPSGFTTANNILKFGGLSDAVSAGITNTHIGETSAVYHGTVSAGATGDVIAIYFLEPLGNVLLCSYTQQPTDSSNIFLAASLASAINANTSNTGYTASASSGSLTLNIRHGLGNILWLPIFPFM